jgi:hypothetical protein
MAKSYEKNPIGNLKYLQFGPVLAVNSVEPKLIKELLERGEKCTVSNAHDLAGHIETENSFPVKDVAWFADTFKEYFIPYFKRLQATNNVEYFYGMKPFNRVLLHSLWINYMKKNEFNPPHTHSGSFSFVIYLDVPKELEQEVGNFKGTSHAPGTISFYYGEEQKGVITAHGIRPLTGDLWIFPASLKHMVPPFRSDVTRISVSGNIFITDQLNKDQPMQPGEWTLTNQGE